MKTVRVTGAIRVSDATSDADVAHATADALRSSELFTVDGWEVQAVTLAPRLPQQDEGAMVGRTYLDRAQCSAPFCSQTAHDQPLFLTGGCHPGKPVKAAYYGGVVRVTCALCGRLVCTVEVAP